MQNNLVPRRKGGTTDCLVGSLWLFDALLKLDEHSVGFFRWFLVAGRTRQRIAKAVLAAISLDDPTIFLHRLGIAGSSHSPCQLAKVAWHVRHGKSHQILAAAFGECQRGFLPMVGRSSFDKRHSFTRLFGMFANHVDRPKLAALRHCPLTDDALEIADALPPGFLRPSLLKGVETPDEARLIAETLETVQAMAGAPSEPDRLEQIEDMEGYRGFVVSRIRTVRLKPPVAGDNEMIALMPSDLKPVGRQMQVCLGGDGYLLEAVSRRLFFYRYLPEPGAIAMLRRLNDTELWLLAEIHGAKNRRVAPHIQEHIKEWFLDRGIPNLTPSPRPPSLESLATLMTGPGLEDMAEFVLG